MVRITSSVLATSELSNSVPAHAPQLVSVIIYCQEFLCNFHLIIVKIVHMVQAKCMECTEGDSVLRVGAAFAKLLYEFHLQRECKSKRGPKKEIRLVIVS